MGRTIFGAIAAAALLLSAGAAQAGASVRADRAIYFTEDEVGAFARFIEDTLIARDARIAIVFRTGRVRSDLPEGVTYTHGAFWVQGEVEEDGVTRTGYRVYNLYQGEGGFSDTSTLVQDLPRDFTAGSVVRDVAIIEFTPQFQEKLLAAIGTERYERMHNPAYSIVSNPHTDLYQNCNEFMLDVIVSVAHDTDDYRKVKEIEAAGFEPQRVTKGPVVDFFLPMVMRDVKVADHTNGFHTATYESMSAYLLKTGLAAKASTVEWPKN